MADPIKLANIDSDNIYIYPLSDRRLGSSTGNISQYGYLSKLNIEDNITDQIKSIVDINSYRIKDLDINLISNGNLKINAGKLCIAGYIFDIKTDINVNIDSYKPNIVYAYFTIKRKKFKIKYSDSVDLYEYELIGEDKNNFYEGLEFNISTTEPILESESNNIITNNFIIGKFKYEDNNWLDTRYNYSSKLKFNLMDIDIDDLSISDTAIEEPVDDWLNNNFILDDGDI